MYSVEEIGPVGGRMIEPADISPDGRVVGTLDPHSPSQDAFVWDPWNGVQILPGLGSQTEALAINVAGVIVGLSGNAAVRWDNEVPTALPAPDGAVWAFTHAINNSGVIGGGFWKPGFDGFAHIWFSSTTHKSLTHELGGMFDEILALNNHSDLQAVGTSNKGGFSWTAASGMVELVGRPHALNDHGEIVGNGNHAVRWLGFSKQPLEMLAGYEWSTAKDLNNAREIVGACGFTGQAVKACIWHRVHGRDPVPILGTLLGIPIPQIDPIVSNPTVEALDSLIDPALGWFLQDAYAINQSGQIIGTGTYQGRPAAFRLTPAASVSTGWAIVAAVVNILIGGRLGNRGLGVTPGGPTPIPPHGPERDLLLATVILELTGQLSDREARAVLRRGALEQIIREANRLLESDH